MGDLELAGTHRLPPPPPLPSRLLLPEVPAVVGVRVAVFGHHNPVGKLPTGQALHGLLGVEHGHELHEDLVGEQTIKRTHIRNRGRENK